MTLINVNVSSMVVPHMDEYTSGASNSFYVKFTFSPEWDDLTKLVSFKAGSTIVSQIMSGDTIAIPHEVLKPCTSLYIGVLGTQGETVVLPTIWKELRKVKYGAEEGTFPVDPTPSQYQQILNIAQSVRDDADAGKFDGKDGVSVVNVEIRDSHLYCTLSDGTEIDAGELPGTYDHSELINRDSEDSHPMSAITGLSSALDGKQPTITDLDTIRSGAAAGATAVRPSALNSYRTSADQDLIDGNLQSKINTIDEKIPSSASAQNQLVTENRMSEAVSAVEAKHLYKTTTQGSFATKAELLAAQIFYNADGTIATPTKNDVTYVLADESREGKLAKYVISTTNPLVWGFVIAISDTNFTQEQLDALNSGITNSKRSGYDTHVADNDIHVTSAQKSAWTNKQDAISDLNDIRAGAGKGNTALQPSALNPYRTAAEQNAIDATKYVKPEDGIPKTDLADDVIPEWEQAEAFPIVTTVNSSSTDGAVPTAKAVYDHRDSTKQDVINDLTDIRAGAAAGIRAESKVDITNKKVSNISELLKGNAYTVEEGDSPAYSQIVETGAQRWAELGMVGGRSVVWNQLADDFDTVSTTVALRSGTTITLGHKYYMQAEIPSGILYFYLGKGNGHIFHTNTGGNSLIFTSDITITADGTKNDGLNSVWFYKTNSTITNPRLYDLTQMFGSGNEPSSVDDPRIAFIESYVASHPEYNAGEIISADVDKVVSNGENILDHSLWHQGNIYNGNVIVQSSPNANAYTDFIAVDGTNYYCEQPNTKYTYCFCYDYEKKYLGAASPKYIENTSFQLLSGTKYVRFMLYHHDAFSIPDILPMSVVRGTTAPASVTPYRAPIEYPIPAAVRALPGYGWSAGYVYNYVDFERKVYVQNVAMLALDVDDMNNSENYPGWKNSGIRSIIGEGKSGQTYGFFEIGDHISINTLVNNDILFLSTVKYGLTQTEWKEQYAGQTFHFYIPLATPIETDISAYLSDDSFIDTEVGGAVTFHQTATELPVPNKVSYMVKLEDTL